MLATDRARPKTDSLAKGPAPEEGDAGAERCRHRDLPDCPRQGDTADGEQIPGGEVHANAEHQQDDANLGKLRSEVGIGDEAGRERSDRDASKQVPDDGRQPQAHRDQAEDTCCRESDRDRADEFRLDGATGIGLS